MGGPFVVVTVGSWIDLDGLTVTKKKLDSQYFLRGSSLISERKPGKSNTDAQAFLRRPTSFRPFVKIPNL
jgi:hypothetical protein